MQIQCPHCGATGRIPDSKVPSIGTQLTCPKCRQPFSIPQSDDNGVGAQNSPSLQSQTGTTSKKVPRSQRKTDDAQRLSWGHRHLPLLIFLATLSGSLLGAVGSFSEALNLLVPVWKTIFPSPHIRVVGSNTILGSRLEMAEDWVEDFQEMSKWQDNIPLVGEQDRMFGVAVDPIGSVTGIKKAIRTKGKKVHVLAASEPIPTEDLNAFKEAGIDFQCAAEIGYDLVVFVSDKNNPTPILSKEDIRKILTAEITDWSKLGQTRSAISKPIVIFARKGSGTTDIILQAFTGSTEFPQHFVECDTNAECLNQALGTPGSLYWVSLSWLYTQPPDYMQVILVQAQENMPPTNPYEEGFNPRWYPPDLIRPLYLYVLKSEATEPEILDVSEQFFHYVRGVHGQKILEQHNFYTYFQPPSDLQPTLPAGFGQRVAGRQTVCR